MDTQELLAKIQGKTEVVEHKEDLGVLNVNVAKEKIRETIIYLKDELGFDLMNFMTALDLKENNNIEIIYRLYSNATDDKVVVRVKLDRNTPEIDTVCDVFRTAEMMEREVFEMFGVKFINHPDLRRLLLPDGVEKPLLKDFEHPDHNPMQ